VREVGWQGYKQTDENRHPEQCQFTSTRTVSEIGFIQLSVGSRELEPVNPFLNALTRFAGDGEGDQSGIQQFHSLLEYSMSNET
jgi:hypothetical protein